MDAEKDDAAALSHEARQQREAEVQAGLLSVERDESWFVWRAMDERLPVEHRPDVSPVALLGLRLVTTPHITASETSPEHAMISFAGGDEHGDAHPSTACLAPGLAARPQRPAQPTASVIAGQVTVVSGPDASEQGHPARLYYALEAVDVAAVKGISRGVSASVLRIINASGPLGSILAQITLKLRIPRFSPLMVLELSHLYCDIICSSK